jgi:hypothetical protein
MYIFDYASTLWLARAYQTTLSKYVVFEHGVELNPNFEREIAGRRGFSPKFVLLLALVVVIILLSPWAGYYFGEFLAGALLLTWSFVNSRHLRNYFYVWFLRRKPEALKGRQEQSYWFMQKMLSSEAFAWGLLYLCLFFLTWRIFFLAGALTCWALTLRAYWLANRKFPPASMRPHATAHPAGTQPPPTLHNE